MSWPSECVPHDDGDLAHDIAGERSAGRVPSGGTGSRLIRHAAGEGPCRVCGCPLYVGDEAYLVDWRLACSKACARRLAAADGGEL